MAAAKEISKLRFYNTLTRKIDDFKPISPQGARIYACGPTVYDYSHIGHVRTYIFVDVLYRTLSFLGFKPLLVMNITDVGHLTSDSDTGEDKMEKGARREGKTVWEIAKFYTDYFFQTMDQVGIKRADIVCKATDHIREMIKLIKRLEDKKFTYKTSDGIYFDTSKFKNYGKLARLDIANLKEGARVAKNPEKRNPTDFALWKFTPQGMRRQMEWGSPWGLGFPGWHIECSAMSMKYLGETFDIHTGGVDHIPVHHTNEIAQSEAATGKRFVNFWLHAGHLLVEGQKMSKSSGNFYKLEDIQKRGFDPLVLRYLFLTGHYRSTMNFEWKALEAASTALGKLRERVLNLKNSDTNAEYEEKFKQALGSDLDIPQALALAWEVVKTGKAKQMLLGWDKVLGLNLGKPKTKIPEDILVLVKEREKIRREEKWTEADRTRQQIEAKGYILKDTSSGTVVKKANE